jgi:uncharacterized protein YutE (UPF0331/DUF86 family)
MALTKDQKKLLSEVIGHVSEFRETVSGSTDPVAQVLRLHALTEYYLEQIIETQMRNGNIIINDNRFGYYHKLQLVNALGLLDPGLLGVLRKLSQLRNNFAHHRAPIVSKKDIRQVAKPLEAKYKLAFHRMTEEPKELLALAHVIFDQFSHVLMVCRMVGPNLSYEILRT